MLGIRWQWWLIAGAALLLLAAPPTRDMLKMQTAGLNPKADYYLWYPLWSADKSLLGLHSIYRSDLESMGDSPMAGAARRCRLRAEAKPDDFVAQWGASHLLLQAEQPSAFAEAARALAARFPERQEALLSRASREIDALPQWPEWYRPELTSILGNYGDRKERPMTEAEAAPALQALDAGMRRFPDNGYWYVAQAGVYFQMGRDEDALKALQTAARKPHLDLASTEGYRLSVQAARESGLPYPEAFDVRSGVASPMRVMRTAQIVRALAEAAADQRQQAKAADYCIAEAEAGDQARRASRSVVEAIVGNALVYQGARPVAEELPPKEARGRHPLPGGARMPQRKGHAWYKGPLYDAVREQAGEPSLHRVLNHLYAATAMTDTFRASREKREPESDAYQRRDALLWHLMVGGAGLVALAASLFLLLLLMHVIWLASRRPQGGLSTEWQGVLLAFSFALAGAIAAFLATRAGLPALAPMLARVVWILPIVLVVVFGVAALVRARRPLSPERGAARCWVGVLHQLLPNALLVVVLGYLALAVPTVVLRHQLTSQGLPYAFGDKRSRFREEIGWDETKVRYPFAVEATEGQRPVSPAPK